MASSSLSFSFLIFTIFLFSSTHAKTAPVAPGPTPAQLSLTTILEKGSQYTTLLRLLKETQVSTQIASQLKSSYDGLTIFAPTDNAFNQLKAGTLNSLTAQEQVELVLYHVLPRFYSLTTFQSASNPVYTQASGNDGVYTINVTTTSNQLNVSTGVNDTPVSSVLYSDFPLAVYSVDSVLLPQALFGPKPPAGAPAPLPAKKKTKKNPISTTAAAPISSADADSTTSDASWRGQNAGWSLVFGVGFGALSYLM
ncbi:fasciclin-like arabinogalactan protein 6 [Carex littledalei]|uniref:Fasciclin-like arabinogalactan protein 6 n=1 Tax=Carex littledalei TaxID=544730 RepID=A0A833QSK4_9POAL|nr:fasciclin-like arabinogalactan protein 6 [Carex littledalei]